MKNHSSLGCLASLLPRIAVGFVLVGYGVNHYRHFGEFQGMSAVFFPTNGLLESTAGLLLYIVPALQIVGGALFAVMQYHKIAKFCVHASLGGIIGAAGLGVLVGPADIGPALMPFIVNTGVLLLVYYYAKKVTCCCTGAGCCGGNCAPTQGK